LVTKNYCQLFQNYSGASDKVEEIVTHLQNELIKRKGKLSAGIALWKKFKQVENYIKQLGADVEILFVNGSVNIGALNSIESNILELEKKFGDYLDSESLWIKLFSFLRFVREKRATRLKQIFRGCVVDHQSIDFFKVSSLINFFDERLSLIKAVKGMSDAWVSWKNYNSIVGNPPVNDQEIKQRKNQFCYDELEVSIKNEMFYLAVHYWEGRWIIETEKAMEDKLDKKGMPDTLWRFQRLAMLTPCFVSTFYMTPKFFSYFKFLKKLTTKNIFERPPLLESIDLLIVDEAGQVSPEVGAATFALAKRAIVVGDVKQIEPVWNVPSKVDHANLHRFGLISAKADRAGIQHLHDRGFLGSSGSIMMLAQKSSCFQLSSKSDRGMLLTEHRRCFDEIIEYCNKLAYGGLLEPLKGKAKNILFEPMKFIPVDGESVSLNSSRANQTEAAEIAKWLKTNSSEIISHYQEKENIEAKKDKRPANNIGLGDIVGIITPFTSQKLTIRAALKNHGINVNGLTIGTVHSLQGAERSIILFSSVYGKNNIGGGYFFDRGVNMLNVAVSRAKDNFIVFGCPDVFEGNNGTPSSMLFKHINKTKTSAILNNKK
ncbi:MAG TPA: DEAD/DEAH box helicase, partial [Cyclobacteriaceae bacterium]|nr:DEAD/DEAH box helicase [Cyclobacteriaceae bacterium]